MAHVFFFVTADVISPVVYHNKLFTPPAEKSKAYRPIDRMVRLFTYQLIKMLDLGMGGWRGKFKVL
uniref:Uncharacterized protein n=1 Tax=Anguilla anguilla TaxID=7936 RepID=A0A0E9WHR4_ANGAN